MKTFGPNISAGTKMSLTVKKKKNKNLTTAHNEFNP